MKKYIVVLAVSMFLISILTARPGKAAGISYATGVTSNSTPVVIATPSANTDFGTDFDMMITNPSATPGAVIVTSGSITVSGTPVPVTVFNHTIGANDGGFISSNYRYPAPVNQNKITLTDVNNVGLEYDFKMWTSSNHTNRP